MGTFGKFTEEGDGSIVDREGWGACIGDCGGMKAEPEEDVV